MLLSVAQGGFDSGVVVVILLGIAIAVGLFFSMISFKAWRLIHKHDLNIPMKRLLGMKIRRTDPLKVVNALIWAKRVGIDDANDGVIEAHMLCGGSIKGFMDALIKGRAAGVMIPFEEASRLHLNGVLTNEIKRRIREKGYLQEGEL